MLGCQWHHVPSEIYKKCRQRVEVCHLIKGYCNDLDIKLVFSSFKIGNLFGVKDPIPGGLHSRVVYKFACVGSNACCVASLQIIFAYRRVICQARGQF